MADEEQPKKEEKSAKVKMIDYSQFLDAVTQISPLVDEIVLKFDQGGVKARAMDVANVAMVDLVIAKHKFAEYDVSTDQGYGVNLKNLKDILRRGGKDTVMRMTFQEKSKISVVFTTKDGKTKSFLLPIIDIEDKGLKIPPLEFTTKMKVAVEDLDEVVKDVEMVITNGSAEFRAENGKVVVAAEGDLRSGVMELPAEDVTKDTTARAKYSVEYLSKMVAKKFGKHVGIEFSSEYPARLTYSDDGYDLTYILAPRVDTA